MSELISNRLPMLAVEIRKAHADVQEAAKTAAQRAIEAGHALIEAKELVDHGGWLPWLRENCALADRTARLYMQVARSGVNSATLANLGLQAAAKTVVLEFPDPFDGTPAEELIEWRLYLLRGLLAGFRAEDSDSYVNHLKMSWSSPSEWMGDAGDRYRVAFGMRPSSPEIKASWFRFLAENCNRTRDDIESEILRLAEAEPPPASEPIRKGRRKSKRVGGLAP
jgi:hypothetical protein